ncbi:tetratricopeptide repeat protein [bacterium]|nr:tetratricopeptide repeat protein [bacterium]
MCEIIRGLLLLWILASPSLVLGAEALGSAEPRAGYFVVLNSPIIRSAAESPSRDGEHGVFVESAVARADIPVPAGRLLGPYDFYPDAVVVLSSLYTLQTGQSVGTGIPGLEGEVDQIFTIGQIVPTDTALQDLHAEAYWPKGFAFPGVQLSASHGLWKDDRYKQLKALDVSGQSAAYQAAVRESLVQLRSDPDDPLYGYAALNMGIFKIQSGEYIVAWGFFQRIVSGYATAEPIHQIMAMRRLAWVHHKMGDKLRAYHYYTDLEGLALGQATAVTCMTERLGLLMELAEQRRWGSHEDVRRAKKQFYSRVPATYIRERAVMDLIEHESWARQPSPDYREAARLGEIIIDTYSSLGDLPQREVGLAMEQTGRYYEMLGENEKALKFYEDVLALPDSIEIFAGVQPQARALAGMGRIAEKVGDADLGLQLFRDVLAIYPNSDTARMIKAGYPEVVNTLAPSPWATARMKNKEAVR